MRVYRFLLEADHEEEEARHMNDVSVLSKLALPPAVSIIRMLRLKLFSRLAVKGTKDVWHAILLAKPSTNSWLTVVHKDLRALTSRTPFLR